jgi:hypothetical protein
MTAAEFRKAALELPEAVAGQHMGHGDFRVGGKIFATIDHPERGWAMVKLSPAEQGALLLMHSEGFKAAAGAWGEKGATLIQLKFARAESVRVALEAAWRGRAPARLLKQPSPKRQTQE